MANSDNSPQPLTVSVALGPRTYPIHIGRGLLDQLAVLFESVQRPAGHAVLIQDANVRDVALAACQVLEQAGWRVTRLEIPAGESSKSLAQLENLWTRMLDSGTDRGSLVVAVGGGVVGDLAGFAAAAFARGIRLVQIPTTLLSQVDSSVGGKTGINLPGAKNIVGAFWQPSLVVIDSATLESLPPREFASGLAEVAKYGVILLPELFAYLEDNYQRILDKQPDVLAKIIADSCRAKAQVVMEDERETTGRRAILNYGHTFAHALESGTGYGTLLHGEAVSIGMHMAACLARRLGHIDAAFVDRQAHLLEQLGLPVQYDQVDPAVLWELMQRDKKVEHGKLRFVLPSRMGHVELVGGIERAQVVAAIEDSWHPTPPNSP